MSEDETLTFDRFRLLPKQRKVLDGDEPLRIGSRALDLLLALVDRAGETVSKEELIAKVWPDTAVDEANLRVHVGALRKALGDRGSEARYILNVPLRGYRFVAPIGREARPAPADSRKRLGLPVTLTRVIGRADNVRAIEAQVRERRFVTIVGPAGIGKTTVALAVAARLAPAFADGACFLDLASLSDPLLVPSALASVLGVWLPEDDPSAALSVALAGKEMLLVIDNCEHLLEATAGLVEAALKGAPSVAVLATSREPMRAEGEWISRLATLAVPPVQPAITARDALSFAAVELFVERAKATSDLFELRDEDASAAAELCRQLDGIPLAIELAAARVEAFGVRGLASRLDDRFRLLMKGRRTALPRQQTLRGAMDWSYEALTADQQTTLRRLAVFQGSFEATAAAAVVASDRITEAEALDHLTELVAKSLVSTDGRERVTYRLLATTRAYALEKLTLHGERSPTLRRHANHVRGLVAQMEESWSVMEPRAWLATYASALDDVRAAIRWALSSSEDAALAVALTLAVPLGAMLSFHAEFRGYVLRAVERMPEVSPLDPSTEMRLNFALGALSTHTEGPSEAALERAYAIAHGIPDVTLRALAIEGVWAVAFNRGDYPSMVRLAEEHTSVVASSASASARLNSDRLSGIALHFSGRHADARPFLERVRAQSSSSGSYHQSVHIEPRISAAISLARALWMQGAVDQALHVAEEAVAWAGHHGVALCYALGFAACPIALWRGDANAARLVETLVETAERQSLSAWKAWGRCYALATAPGSVPRGFCVLQLDMLGTLREDLAGAEVVARVEAGQVGWCAPEVLRASAENLIRQGGDTTRAEPMLLRALALARQQGALSWELRTAMSLAKHWRHQGRSAEGRSLLEGVLSRFTEGYGTRDLSTARILMAAFGGPAL